MCAIVEKATKKTLLAAREKAMRDWEEMLNQAIVKDITITDSALGKLGMSHYDAWRFADERGWWVSRDEKHRCFVVTKVRPKGEKKDETVKA